METEQRQSVKGFDIRLFMENIIMSCVIDNRNAKGKENYPPSFRITKSNESHSFFKIQ